MTGEPFTNLNFAPDQPADNETDGVFANSLALQKASNWEWNDLLSNSNTREDHNLGYICEWGWEDSYIQKKVFNGHTYAYMDLPMTWGQSRDYCIKLGGHLATVNSEAEQVFIQSVYATSERHMPKTYYWLGGHTQTPATKNGWVWVTGEAISSSLVYLNWIEGQPDYIYNGTNYENKLMLRTSDGQWSDELNDPIVKNSTGILIEWE